MKRREFIAVSVAASASSAVLGQSIAPLESKNQGSLSRGGIGFPAPSIAKLQRLDDQPNLARLVPGSASSPAPQVSLSDPILRVQPLECIVDRIADDTSVTVEAYYPSPRLYSILYSAHNHELGVFPAATQIKAPLNARGQITLRVTQRAKNTSKSRLITLHAASSGTYLLAIPTAGHSSNASWRLTKAQLDNTGRITRLTNPLQTGSTHCAYISITIDENNNSGQPLSNQSRGE
jgi:hypothetical protein